LPLRCVEFGGARRKWRSSGIDDAASNRYVLVNHDRTTTRLGHNAPRMYFASLAFDVNSFASGVSLTSTFTMKQSNGSVPPCARCVDRRPRKRAR
jgi:hypothetical protein